MTRLTCYVIHWEGLSPNAGAFGAHTKVVASCEEQARRELIERVLHWGAQVRKVLRVEVKGVIEEVG